MKRPKVKHLVACVTLFVAAAGAMSASTAAKSDTSPVLAENGASAYSIVIAAKAPPAVLRGARELQTYLDQMSGAKLPFRRDAGPVPDRALFVGASRHLERFKAAPDPAKLGPEAFILRSAGPHLFIVGGSPRGTMYGCTALLERLGVRWFTPTVTKVPQTKRVTLPKLDVQESPDFEYREPFFTEAQDRDWAARNRLNGHSVGATKTKGVAAASVDPSIGGTVRFRPFVHSFDELVPPSLYVAHPEYFPLVKGKRIDGYVQRCLTNPEVLRLSIAAVRRWIREDPGATYYSVSQNDTDNYCECDACRAVTARYGAQSGLYLWFANQVAEAIARDHPDKLIDTLAYQFTEEPPMGIAPRPNVRVRLCATSTCAAHPLEGCALPANAAFVKKLRGWDAITDRLNIWHYSNNYNTLMPFPNFAALPVDIQLYKRSGVTGVFIQGAADPGGGGADAELRSWVLGKLLWNADVDANALVTEWMKGVYGEAWQPMRRWFDIQHEKARDPASHFGISDSAVTAPYLTPATIAEGDRLFDEAERLAAGSPSAADYVAKSRLWLRYAKLMRQPSVGVDFDAFLEDIRRRGITRLQGEQDLASWAQGYKDRSLKGMGK